MLSYRSRARRCAEAAALAALLSAPARALAVRAVHRAAEGPLAQVGADPACAVDFDTLTAVARRDYAGYQTAVEVRSAAVAALTDTLRRATADAPSDARVCEATLGRWLSFFQDGHLRLVPTSSPSAAGGSGSSPSTLAPARGDPGRPSLVALDSATILFRIPSFDLMYKPAIDSLLSSQAPSLARASALIIDVRGNGGGGDATFAGLIPLLYTDPIRVIGADAWASPANAAYFRDLLNIPELPASDRDLVHRLVAEMERNPNHFVAIDRDTILQWTTVPPAPRAVAVVFDRGSGSTTEEFLLQARQSRKTVLFSRARSAGALDYANVRQVLLPSGRWQFRFGTSRSRRLPTDPVDRVGVAPSVQIPAGVTDEPTYVRGYLAAHARR